MNSIVYVSRDPVAFYNEYHQNYINKLIHAFCIPLIVLSIRIFTNNVICTYVDNLYSMDIDYVELENFFKIIDTEVSILYIKGTCFFNIFHNSNYIAVCFLGGHYSII